MFKTTSFEFWKFEFRICFEFRYSNFEFILQGTGGFLNPKKILDELEIKAPSRIADFGCGHGYFTIPLAEIVGEEGLIYAVDVLQDALNEVKAKADGLGIKNIQVIRGNLEIPGGSKVPDNACDLVLLANILFQSQKKSDILKEAKRVVKHGGYLVIIDWQVAGAKLTADSGWRISSDEVRRLAEAENFSFQREFGAGQYHYGIIFRKS